MDDEDFSKLSIHDRISHKSWKARQSGYEETLLLLGKNESFVKIDHVDINGLLQVAVSDSNQVAQESGLAVLVQYLQRSNDASQKSNFIPVLAEKCLSSSRLGTKSKAVQVLMLYVEIAGPVPVIEGLQNLLCHKTPKVVAACINAIKQVVVSFGIQDFPLKSVLKNLGNLFDHKDKTVRAEATALAIEIYKWIGTPLLASLTSIKPVQLKELNAQFENATVGNCEPSRFRRGSENKLVSKSSEVTIAETELAPKIPDVFDLPDPVPFLEKLPKNFYTDLASTKWKERKETLELLLGLVSYPKLEDGKYFELVNVLTKKLNDPNVIVAVLVTNILEKLALGLRGSFAIYRNIVLGPLLDKMKEKKSNILQALRSAVDAVLLSLPSINDALEELITFIKHSHPSTRNESIRVVCRFFQFSNKKKIIKLKKNEIKALSEQLIKSMDDGVPDIRDSAASALALMLQSFGDKVMSIYLDRLDKGKASKIRVLAANEVVDVAAVPAKHPATFSRSSSSINTVITETSESSSATVKKIVKKKVASKTPVIAKEASSNNVFDKPAEPIKYEFSNESAKEFIQTLLGEEKVKLFTDSNWKVRLQAIQDFKELIASSADYKAEPVIRFLSQTPGWKESNFQVLIGLVGAIQVIVDSSRGFDRGCALLATPGLVDKLGDVKIKKAASNCLETIVTCVSAQAVFSSAYPTIKSMKAPKIIAESLQWIAQIIKEFGIVGINLKELAEFSSVFLGHATPAIRNNATAIFVAAAQIGGQGTRVESYSFPDVRSYVTGCSATVLSTLDVELDKVSHVAAVPIDIPLKAQNVTVKASVPAVNKADLSLLIQPALLEQMNSPNWKDRKAGLEELRQIVDGCNNAINPNLGSDFITCFKNRLSDSNKNLACSAVDICGKIASGVGKPFEKYVRNLLPPMLSQLSDQKATIRAPVILCLDKIYAATGASPLLSCLIASLTTEQPQIRKELLAWISDDSKPFEFDGTDANIMIPCILACLLDRSADVRKLAISVLLLLSCKVDANTIRAKAADLYHGAQYSTLAPYLDSLGFKAVDAPLGNASVPAQRTEKQKASGKGSRPLNASLKNELYNISSENDLSPIVSYDLKLKEHRASLDRGILKWNFDVPRKEMVDLLSDQFQGNCSVELQALLFSSDHYKEKDFLSGLKMLDAFVSEQSDREMVIQKCIANCDLILRYLTLRFFDTNTSIFIKSLDLLENFISALDEGGYLLNEFEAGSFIPFFMNKVGDPKESMRVKLRVVLKRLGRVYPVSKLLLQLLKGLDSKNAKTRAECLEEIGSLIQRHGQSVFVPAKSVPVIAAQVSDRDSACRNAALTAISHIYDVLGDDVNKYFTKISEKEKDMITERIRRLPGKSKPAFGKTSPLRSSTPSKLALSDKPKFDCKDVGEVPKEFSLDLETIGLSSLASFPKTVREFEVKSNEQDSVEERLSTRLEVLITQLSGSDIEIAIEATRQLEKLLLAHPNNELMQTTDIVGTISPLINQAFSKLHPHDSLAAKYCKNLVSLLVSIFSTKESALLVPYSSIENCIKIVIYRLVDPDLAAKDSSKTLARALNMLMVRIIDNCKPNATFRSLLLILREGSSSQASIVADFDIQKKYTELVMKCIWKITKIIPIFLEDGALHVDLLLLEIYSFLQAAPPQFWKQKALESGNSQLDMPLRTVKTILHELVNYLGDNILQFLSVLPDQENQTVTYIGQMLESVKKKAGTENLNFKNPVLANPETDFVAQLDSIFVQIADKQKTKVGIQRLHDIQLKYPSIMPLVEERLNKTGTYFQGYIRRGLSALLDQKISLQPRNDTVLTEKKGYFYFNAKKLDNNPDYNETLQKLQRLFRSTDEIKTNVTPRKTPAKMPASEPKAPDSVSRESRSLAVQELKERLAKMKAIMMQGQNK